MDDLEIALINPTKFYVEITECHFSPDLKSSPSIQFEKSKHTYLLYLKPPPHIKHSPSYRAPN